MKIEDGTGTGRKVKIDLNTNLRSFAITKPEDQVATLTGNRYNIITGDITLTDATATSVLCVKNNEDSDLVITAAIYNLGNSTGGSGDGKIDIIRNPTAGTIITDAVNVDVGTGISANANFGSNQSLTADIYKGDTADNDFTTSDGVFISTRLASPEGRTVVSLGSINLPKGASLGITYTPPSSNTSQICQFALSCFLRASVVSGD